LRGRLRYSRAMPTLNWLTRDADVNAAAAAPYRLLAAAPELDGGGTGGGRGEATRDADVARLEEELSQRLGARVSIRHSGKAGRVVIHYHSLDELDGIIGRIK